MTSNTEEPSQTTSARVTQPVGEFFKQAGESAKSAVYSLKDDGESIAKELRVECYETLEITESIDYIRNNAQHFFFIPFLPAFHKPGWLLRYFLGPYTLELFLSFFSDFWAGITVSLTLIPQVRKVFSTTFIFIDTIFIFSSGFVIRSVS